MGCINSKQPPKQKQSENIDSNSQHDENKIQQVVEKCFPEVEVIYNLDQAHQSNYIMSSNAPQFILQKISNNKSLNNNFQNDKKTLENIAFNKIRQFYKIGQIIGNGSFGTIRICASKIEQSRRYALKTISKERMQNQIHLIKRELDTLQALDHPNIIKFYEIYTDVNNIHFIMEYCEGGDLYEKVLNFGPLMCCKVSQIMKQIFSAVQQMHQKGLVHRDLKPENILFTKAINKNGAIADVKLIDFGLSTKFFNDQNKQLQLYSVVGTPLYVAPEIIEEKSYGQECDCWSLGVMTYFLLSGKEAFLACSSGQVFDKIKKAEFDFQHPVWDNVTESAKDFITKLLVLDPKKRLSAKEALNHEFLQSYSAQSTNHQNLSTNKQQAKVIITCIQNIITFQSKLKLKQEAIRILMNHQITSQELVSIQQSFIALDENNTGDLSIDILLAAMNKLGMNDKVEEMRDALQAINQEQGGLDKLVLKYSDFIRTALNLNKYLQEEKLLTLFKQFDIMEKGYFDASDIVEQAAREGRELAYEEIDAMMRQLNLEPDAQITFELFKQVMKQDIKEKDLVYEASSNLGIIYSAESEIESAESEEKKHQT